MKDRVQPPSRQIDYDLNYVDARTGAVVETVRMRSFYRLNTDRHLLSYGQVTKYREYPVANEENGSSHQ